MREEALTLLGGTSFEDLKARLAFLFLTDRWALKDLELARLGRIVELVNSAVPESTVSSSSKLSDAQFSTEYTVVPYALSLLATQARAFSAPMAAPKKARGVLAERLTTPTSVDDQRLKLFLAVGSISNTVTPLAPYTGKLPTSLFMGALAMTFNGASVTCDIPFGAGFLISSGPFELAEQELSFGYTARTETAWGLVGEAPVTVSASSAAEVANLINTYCYAPYVTEAASLAATAISDTCLVVYTRNTPQLSELSDSVVYSGSTVPTIWGRLGLTGELNPFYSPDDLALLMAEVGVTATYSGVTEVVNVLPVSAEISGEDYITLEGLSAGCSVDLNGLSCTLVEFYGPIMAETEEGAPPYTVLWKRDDLYDTLVAGDYSYTAPNPVQYSTASLGGPAPDTTTSVSASATTWTLLLEAESQGDLELEGFLTAELQPADVCGTTEPESGPVTLPVSVYATRVSPLGSVKVGDRIGGSAVVAVTSEYLEVSGQMKGTTIEYAYDDLLYIGRKIVRNVMADLYDIAVAVEQGTRYDRARLLEIAGLLRRIDVPSVRRSSMQQLLLLFRDGNYRLAYQTLLLKDVDTVLAMTATKATGA